MVHAAIAGGAPVRRLMGVQILATGSYVPDQVVDNEDLATLGFDAEWILQRTGIRERRILPPNWPPATWRWPPRSAVWPVPTSRPPTSIC